MNTILTGIVHVAGEQDTGKTMFSFSSGAQPEDTAFVDDDIKGINVVNQIKEQGRSLGFYSNFIEEGKALKEVELHKLGLNIISQIESTIKEKRNGKPFDTLIWDTWSRMETTFHPWVATFPGSFRAFWSAQGVIKGAEQWKVSFQYESEILDRLQHCARLVILTTHLKPDVQGGKKTGKFVPDCKVPLVRNSILRVYLKHNPDSPAPIGLILKRISKQVVTEKGINIVSVLPRRMKPFTWDRIRYYWENPVDNRQLTADEKPDEYELSILDGTLTNDQKWMMSLQTEIDEVADTEEFSSDTVERVKSAKSSGKSVPLIAKEESLSVQQVSKILSL